MIGLSRRPPIGGNDVPRVAVDLRDRGGVQAKLGTQSDVTHIFYEARFDHVEGTPEPIDTNVAMFRNLIDTVVPIAANLVHVHTGSGHKNYGLHKGPACTPAREDAPRYPGPSFYYEQEDYIHALQMGQAWSWSSARPTGLCDTAPGITRSMISLICAYAAIRKELGLPFAVQFSRYRRELSCAVSMYGGAAAREGDSLDGDGARVRQSRFQHNQRGFIPVVEPLAEIRRLFRHGVGARRDRRSCGLYGGQGSGLAAGCRKARPHPATARTGGDVVL
ncbi:MAG: hypothetical protein VX973_11495, partial [Pseudomonadota bacterium]|nr:hypothetical protein [Pseudomonadota bacterium]